MAINRPLINKRRAENNDNGDAVLITDVIADGTYGFNAQDED